jgi:competence protein ComGF
MKTFSLLIALVLLSSCATHTSFNDFYQSNQKEADFSLGLNSSLISSFLSDEEYEDIKPLLKKAKHVRILVFSENSDDMSKKFDKFISKSSFDDMVKIKDDNDKVNVFTLEEKSKIKEVVVEVRSDDDFVLLGLKTNLSQDDIAALIND